MAIDTSDNDVNRSTNVLNELLSSDVSESLRLLVLADPNTAKRLDCWYLCTCLLESGKSNSYCDRVSSGSDVIEPLEDPKWTFRLSSLRHSIKSQIVTTLETRKAIRSNMRMPTNTSTE